MADSTKQQVDTFYKILASIATGGAILGSVATTYWAAKDTSLDTRTLVQDTASLVRENTASNQAALNSFVANTEKHLFILHDKSTGHEGELVRLRNDIKALDGKVYDLMLQRASGLEPKHSAKAHKP